MYSLLIIFVFTFYCADAYRFDYTYSQEAEGWLKLHRIPATWKDAYLNCYYEGAVLASPENDNMKLALTKLNDVSCGLYTGIHATYGKGAYFSVKVTVVGPECDLCAPANPETKTFEDLVTLVKDHLEPQRSEIAERHVFRQRTQRQGTPVSRMPIDWAPDEPDNADNAEDCLIMLNNGTLADVNCFETFPYFCYSSTKKDINSCGTVDDEYFLETRTGSCYKVHRTPLNWTRAFVACAREGGYLAIVNSVIEARIISTLWDSARPHFVAGQYNRDIAFLGFRTFENNFQWMTIHGQTLAEAGYEFSDGQPDNPGVQNCGAMFKSGLLDDNSCDNTLPFICEKDPASLLSDPSNQ